MSCHRIARCFAWSAIFLLVGLAPRLVPAEPPAVILLSPADESTVSTLNVALTCSATDDAGLLDATLYRSEGTQTVTFSGAAQTEDAQISADAPNTNYGAVASINIDGATPHGHGVVKFPNLFGAGPGQAPLGATILSAQFQVNCTNVGNTVNVYRLLEDWVESEATWNQRAGGVSWGNAGADGPVSRASAGAAMAFGATGWRTADLTALVQEWSNGAPNHGFVMTDGGADGVDYDSSESANPPVMTVTYQMPPQAAETQTLSGTSAEVTFYTTVVDGKRYTWNCLVRDTDGGLAWAAADWQFNVDVSAPAMPVLVRPADNATNVGLSALLEVTVGDAGGGPLDVTFYGCALNRVEDFTIVALPDTQKYTFNGYPQLFESQTLWIAENVAARRLAFVSHQGDLVENWDNTSQWEVANTCMSLLDGAIPCGMGPGNHDMYISGSTHDTTYYNQYFPYTRYEAEPWYGGHFPADKNDSNYQLFSAGGIDFVAVHLQFWPSSADIAWADSVFEQHAGRIGILSTHGFLGLDGSHNVHVMGSTQYIWDGVVAPNPNVWFVLCGHVHGERLRVDTVNGHPVYQMLADYQSLATGGDGLLRLLRFAPLENLVHVQTYSPYYDRYETDADSQFSLDFPMNALATIGAVTGVASGANASIVWPDLDPNTDYAWYAKVTNAAGKSTIGPFWYFATGSGDLTPPVLSGAAATDVTDNNATIAWTTDEPADSRVEYGLDAMYGAQVSDAALVTGHALALTNLAPETTYHYRVLSRDAAGNEAVGEDLTFATLAGNHPPVADPQSVITAEDTPLDVTLTASDADPGDVLSFEIVEGPQAGALSGTPPLVRYTPGADFNGSDAFTFKADDGRADSNIATVTITVTPVNDAPAAPQNLAATAGYASVSLDWADNSETEGDLAGYRVYRSTTPGAYGAPLAATAASAYVDDAALNGVTCYYVVTAVDADGLESAPSAEVAATPIDTLLDAYAAQNPTLTFGSIVEGDIAGTHVVSDGQAQRLTEAPSGNAGRARLDAEYRLHTIADPARVTGLTLRLAATWTAYQASDPLAVAIWNGAVWEDITADIADGAFTPAAAPQGYIGADGDLRVRFTDTAAIKNEQKDSLSIDLLYAHVVAGPPDTTPPAAPTELAATAGDAAVDLEWADNGEADLAGYHVYRATAEAGDYTRLTADPVAASAWRDSGVANGTTYFYKITAIDTAGNESAPSLPASATPVDAPPSAPTSLAATAGDGLVTLDWSDNSESDLRDYSVYRAEASGGPYARIATAVTASTFQDTIVINGTTYYYVVTALDAAGQESAPSVEASATPAAQAEIAVHVGDISMGKTSAGPNWKGTARVPILDAGGAGVAGVTVTGDWLFNGNALQTAVTAVTDAAGSALFTSSPVKTKVGTFMFRVTGVAPPAGFRYDAAANVEIEDTIVVP